MVEGLIKNFEFKGVDEIATETNSRRFKAFGTVELVDRHNEILPIEEFTKSLDDWMSNGGTLLDNHKGAPIGKALRWNKTLKSGLPAIEIVGEIYKTRLGNKIWEDMRKGKKEGLSVGGSITNKETNEAGDTILRGLEIDEFSIVERAGNQGATLETMSLAKSEDTVISEDEVKEVSPDESKPEELPQEDNSKEMDEFKNEIKTLTTDLNNLKKMVEEVIATVTGTPAETPTKVEDVEKSEDKTETKVEEKVEKSANDLILEELQSISKRLDSLETTKAETPAVVDEEDEEEEKKPTETKKTEEEIAKSETVEKVETPAPNHSNEMDVKKTYSEVYKELTEGKITSEQAQEELRNL